MTLTVVLGIAAVIYAATLFGFRSAFKNREKQIRKWEDLDRGEVE